jgi:epsilon-lactone hydrolase
MAMSAEAKEVEKLFQCLAQGFPKEGDLFLERCIYDQVYKAAVECPNVVLEAVTVPAGDNKTHALESIKFKPVVANLQSSKCAVLLVHDVGHSFGSPNGHRELAARLANACQCMALSLNYLLSHKHPYPAALDDCITA